MILSFSEIVQTHDSLARLSRTQLHARHSIRGMLHTGHLAPTERIRSVNFSISQKMNGPDHTGRRTDPARCVRCVDGSGTSGFYVFSSPNASFDIILVPIKKHYGISLVSTHREHLKTSMTAGTSFSGGDVCEKIIICLETLAQALNDPACRDYHYISHTFLTCHIQLARYSQQVLYYLSLVYNIFVCIGTYQVYHFYVCETCVYANASNVDKPAFRKHGAD